MTYLTSAFGNEMRNPVKINPRESTETQFNDYLRSGHTLFFFDTYDYEHLDALIMGIFSNKEKGWDYTNVVEFVPGLGGFRLYNKEYNSFAESSEFVGGRSTGLQFYDFLFNRGHDKGSMIVVKGFNQLLSSCPECVSWIRMVLENNIAQTRNAIIMIFADIGIDIPAILVPYSVKFKLRPPDAMRIEELIEELIKEKYDCSIEELIKEKYDCSKDFIERLKDFLAGFSEEEIRRIIAYSTQWPDPRDVEEKVRDAKRAMVERVGVLKLEKESCDFAGLNHLRKYLERVKQISESSNRKLIRQWKKPNPKGILLVGMPGCGKSMCAKAAQQILSRPLIQLDIGRLLGKYVGESERNLRIALDVAERASPCILWIDELEKAFSGMDSSDGTTMRLFGSFLTWMQENKSDVYVIATANNIEKLPDEFKRRGRFDAIFRIQMPTCSERKEIFKYHLRNVMPYKEEELEDLCRKLAERTRYSEKEDDGFSGADIAAIVKNAVWSALASNRTGVNENVIVAEIEKMKGKAQRDVMGARYTAIRERLQKSGYEPASNK